VTGVGPLTPPLERVRLSQGNDIGSGLGGSSQDLGYGVCREAVSSLTQASSHNTTCALPWRYSSQRWQLVAAESRTQSGDFSAFVVQEVSRYGGHARGTNAIPELQARWTLKSDATGFQALATGVSFAEVQAALRQIFGPPAFVTTNAAGQPHGLFKALDIGVALQFVGEPSGTRIICVRGVKL
jgi:hypothetical protein